MTSPKGSAGRQQGLVGGESSEMVAVGAEADMPVGPDYQKRDLADAQLIGCGGGEPSPRVPIAGSRVSPIVVSISAPSLRARIEPGPPAPTTRTVSSAATSTRR